MKQFFLVSPLLIIGCSNSNSKTGDIAVGKEAYDLPKKKVMTRQIWKEYKIDAGISSLTQPYPGCYIRIDGNEFVYMRSDTVVYKDTLIVEKDQYNMIFRFRSHTGDELFFIDDDTSEVLLKRNNYDDIYEYFRREIQ